MTHRLLACSLWLSLGACNVFDAQLYQDAEDAGPQLETIVLADQCTGELPVVESLNGPRSVSTIGLNDTFSSDIAACTGAAEPGNDGFFQVTMALDEKWHFHLRLIDAGANPALYVLRSCDERSCSSQTSLDECGTGRDEHMSFVAPAAGTYIVGVDARAAGGAAYEITAVSPVCGNGGTPEHSETCDDGNTDPGDGCSPDCRAEVSDAAPTELEPNDEATNANIAMPDPGSHHITVQGQLGGRCDFDMWAVDVPDGGAITATMLDSNGDPCADGTIPFKLSLFQGDGHTVAGVGAVEAGNACPMFDETAAFAHDLEEGRHFVRVTTVNDEATAVGYRLDLGVLPGGS